MKFSIPREALLHPLEMVSGVVERRQTMPILANVLLELSRQKLEIVANDTEVELLSSIDLAEEPEITGSITAPGRKLMEICRASPDKTDLDISLSGNKLIVAGQESSFSLTTLPATDFPRAKLDDKVIVSFSLPQEELLALLKRTHFAIADQGPHFYLRGLLLDIKDGVIHTVASDGHRLAMAAAEDDKLKKITAQAILPRKTILELIRLLEHSKNKITVEISANHARFIAHDFTLTSKLIDSKYPNPAKLIPRGGDKKVLIDRKLLRDALARVAILSNEVLRNVKIELSTNAMHLLATNPECEKAEDFLPVDYKGENLNIGFNIAYLLDALNAMEAEKVLAIFKDSESGLILEDANSQNNCLYVVMPLEI